MANQFMRVIEKQTERHWDYEIPQEAPECLQKIVDLMQGIGVSRDAIAGYVGPAIEIRKLEE